MIKKKFSLMCLLVGVSPLSYAHGQEAIAWGLGWLAGVLLSIILIFTIIKGWQSRIVVFLLSSASGFSTGLISSDFYRNFLNNDGGLWFMFSFGVTTLVLMITLLFVRVRQSKNA
jgi:hypothetical protein